MTLTHYEMRFAYLDRHVVLLVPTEREKIRRFINGLSYGLRFSMAREVAMDARFDQVIEIARNLEQVRRLDREKREAKRPHSSGMDWLSPCHAILDCHAKTVTLEMLGLPRVEWRGSLDYVPSRVISYLKAQRIVETGCLAYFAFIRDVSADVPTIESVPVVRDFLDVFPADLREDHKKHMRIVLQTLRKKKLYAKFSKCEFWLDSVTSSSHVVSNEGMEVDPKKIKAIQIWTRLSSATEIRSFMGLFCLGLVQNSSEMVLGVLNDGLRFGYGFPVSSIWFYPFLHGYGHAFCVFVVGMHIVVDFEPHGSSYSKWAGVWIGSRTVAELCWDISLCVCFVCFGSTLCDGFMALRLVVVPIELAGRDLELKEDDWVFLKVSPMKGVLRFVKKGKLSPRYVGFYKIIQRIGEVAYKLELPPEMSLVHPIFYVSVLKKVVGDPTLIVPVEIIEINEELTYEEIPVSIIDRQVRKLRKKEIASVKVLWQNKQVKEATWEAEQEIKNKYPYLFELLCNRSMKLFPVNYISFVQLMLRVFLFW
ncbi:uncharacterized protein [Nicotiana tomentosiformis]|uniref:uncharacterized protein n=1 Tax=Nicotiana tomentosiformis TaxID=4098 RepID=UPI00388CE801